MKLTYAKQVVAEKLEFKLETDVRSYIFHTPKQSRC